jgi:aminopeptidase
MERINKLAKIIVNHSIKVKENDKVLVTYDGIEAMPLVKAIMKEVINNKGIVEIEYTNQDIENYIRENLTDKMIETKANKLKFQVENFDCFVRICYRKSDYYDKNMDKDMKKKITEATQPYKEIRVNERRWVLLNYPSIVDATKAHMTPEEFYNFSLDAMTIDYEKMYNDTLPLKELMEKTDRVRIVAPNTDITFSIKGLPAIICAGECNIPDGECFTAPVKDSVNGTITYNVPSPYHGEIFEHVSLTFKDGKIVEARSNNNEKLKEIFETDEGARYVGEFSLGFNPMIKKPMGDILFDEKIAGSLHFTPGCSYDECPNGNKSGIHWDLVLIQREEYGGGEIYFDDVLIRKNGLFVLPELENLNYK